MSESPEPTIELVITAPEPFGALMAYRTRCRTTMGVLTQLIAEAERHVIIAAPFMQSGYGLSSGTLADALRSALQRGVNVDILSTGQSLQTIDQGHLMRNSKGRLRFFRAAAHIEDCQHLGSHAKFCVADSERAYVGSANLTGPGLTSQIEMGVFIRGSIARQIEQFWEYAIEIGLFLFVTETIAP
jgi:phosphatidylserine/phosphatidylglycerophosphate/cardiolipin synthase-like enzyme